MANGNTLCSKGPEEAMIIMSLILPVILFIGDMPASGCSFSTLNKYEDAELASVLSTEHKVMRRP